MPMIAAPKRTAIVQSMGEAETWVNKIIKTKEAFILITDNANMDKLLKDDSKHLSVYS